MIKLVNKKVYDLFGFFENLMVIIEEKLERLETKTKQNKKIIKISVIAILMLVGFSIFQTNKDFLIKKDSNKINTAFALNH